MRKWSLLGAGIAIVIAATFATVAGAMAANVVSYGRVAPAGLSSSGCSACTSFQGVTATGQPSFTFASDGVITSWSTRQPDSGCNTGCTARVRIFRPTGGGNYTFIAQSANQTLTNLGIATFTASIPVKAGDHVGLEVTNGIQIYLAPTGDDVESVLGDPTLGSTVPPCGSPVCHQTTALRLVNVQASLTLPPTVSAVTASCGAAAGGGPVTITGNAFTGATGVTFGTKAALSFSIVSDTRINAVAPAGTASQVVDIKVTTPAGTSGVSSADRCTYAAAAAVTPALPKAGAGQPGGFPAGLSLLLLAAALTTVVAAALRTGPTRS